MTSNILFGLPGKGQHEQVRWLEPQPAPVFFAKAIPAEATPQNIQAKRLATTENAINPRNGRRQTPAQRDWLFWSKCPSKLCHAKLEPIVTRLEFGVHET